MRRVSFPPLRALAATLLLFSAAWPAAGDKPLFRFGVVSDIQYGDKDTKGLRQYRRALELLPACVEKFNAEHLDFIVHGGDLADGYATDPAKSQAEMLRVLDVFRRFEPPARSVIGNHCLNAGPEFLKRELKMESFHYEFTVPAAKGWRFVVLDGNDAGYGVMSDGQIAWFEARLADAAAKGERVIVFCHYPLVESPPQRHVLKNAEPLVAAIEKSGCVAAWIAGHHHAGGHLARAGVHYVTVKGLVESTAGASFAIFDVYPDRLREDGFGDEPDREMALGAGRSPEAPGRKRAATSIRRRARKCGECGGWWPQLGL